MELPSKLDASGDDGAETGESAGVSRGEQEPGGAGQQGPARGEPEWAGAHLTGDASGEPGMEASL